MFYFYNTKLFWSTTKILVIAKFAFYILFKYNINTLKINLTMEKDIIKNSDNEAETNNKIINRYRS